MDPSFPFARDFNSTPSRNSFTRPVFSRSQSLYSAGTNYPRPNTYRPPAEMTRLSPSVVIRRDLRVSNSLPPALLPTPPGSDFDVPPSHSPPTIPSPASPAAPHPPSLSVLTPETISHLRSTREGTYILPDIPPADFLAWQALHSSLLDSESSVKYAYDGFSQRLIITCMAGHLHDSPSIFFVRRVGDDLRDAGRVCRRQLQIASTTEFTGFAGEYEGLGSRKAPDAYVKVAGTDGFPSVVVESGWAESMEDLVKDARLWLLGTGGATKVCIVVHFLEERAARVPKPESDDDDDDDDSPSPASDETASACFVVDDTRPVDPFPEETALLASITRTTPLNSISRDILALHRLQKLSQPLLRPFTASFHVYRANTTFTGILEVCTLTVLPAPPSPADQVFELSLKDLYGDAPVPEGVDPEKKIRFEMEELREDIADQVPAMEKMRADARALGVVRRVGGSVVGETFAMGKKRGEVGKRKRDGEGDGEWVKAGRRGQVGGDL